VTPEFTLAGTAAVGAAHERLQVRRSAATPTVGAVAAVAIVFAVWGWLRPEPPVPVTRYPTTLTADGQMRGTELVQTVAIAPDGSAIVYRDTVGGTPQLLLKGRQEMEPQPLAGTDGARGPFFSPDGAWLGFFADGQLHKMSALGGGSVTLADSAPAGFPASGTWLDDGTIVFTDASIRLRRVSAAGGAASVVVAMQSPRVYSWGPSALPDARGVLFTGCSASCVESGVYVWDAQRDTVRMLFDGGFGVWYAPTGDILYLTRQGVLLAAPWDRETLAPSGAAVPILEGIQAPGFAFSAEGTALYVVGPRRFDSGLVPDAEAVWVDMGGNIEPVDPSWRFNTGGANWGLALSPEGNRLAIRLNTDLGQDVWIKQLPTGPASRLTLSYDGEDRAPRWAPDGRAVTFVSDRPIAGDSTEGRGRWNVWSRAADGTGGATLLWQGPQFFTLGYWSPDAQWLVLRTGGHPNARGGRDILGVRLGTDSVVHPLLATEFDEQAPAISPDSRWLAYLSAETGRNEVFVRPFPETNRGKWQVSQGGATAPLWAHHGHRLFYWANDSLMTVEVQPGPPVSVGQPHALFPRPDRIRSGGQLAGLMDISPDDQRFIMVRNIPLTGEREQPTLVMMQSFFTELQSKMGK
jgi:serine/threonine-protein kinase